MNRKPNERDVFEVITDVEHALVIPGRGWPFLIYGLIAWVLKTIPKRTVSQQFTALCMSP
nr:MAG TPA: hypothetical protein [Caudoviricetes sp.]